MDEPQLQMILQILADAGLLQHCRNAVLVQLRGRPDAGEQHELHRADRAGRQNHFAAAAREFLRAILDGN